MFIVCLLRFKMLFQHLAAKVSKIKILDKLITEFLLKKAIVGRIKLKADRLKPDNLPF
jgi:hypothetical protein